MLKTTNVREIAKSMVQDRKAAEAPKCETPGQCKALSDAELATVLAALRLWQDRDEFYSGGRVETLIDYLMKDCGVEPLDEDQIDELIEKLNEPAVKPCGCERNVFACSDHAGQTLEEGTP